MTPLARAASIRSVHTRVSAPGFGVLPIGLSDVWMPALTPTVP
jgi:hypothetical protein